MGIKIKSMTFVVESDTYDMEQFYEQLEGVIEEMSEVTSTNIVYGGHGVDIEISRPYDMEWEEEGKPVGVVTFTF